ncbi:MAG: FecR domain-containing protein [Deltaproteobacteria bacterium]|nr:FecR domain-containing protein [Candidatus Zymogenaceae bacterium]
MHGTLRTIVLKTMCIAAPILLAALFIAGGMKAARGEDAPAALVSYLDGFVDIKHADTDMLLALSAGDQLIVGDTIQTGPEGTVELVLPDGSAIKIGPDSLVNIKEMGTIETTGIRLTTIELIMGKVRALVTPAHGGEANFFIKTENATIGVRGTDFVTLFDPDLGATNVISIDECVEVVAAFFPDIDPLSVCSGTEVTVFTATGPTAVTAVDVEKLNEILTEMAFHTGIVEGRIILPDAGSAAPPYIVTAFLNTVINLEDIDDTLRLSRDDLDAEGGILISGSASDDTFPVTGVEWSIDGGFEWNRAEGDELWRFRFVPQDGCEYEVMVRATNAAGVVSDPTDVGTWRLSYRDAGYYDIAGEYLQSLFGAIENADITTLDELISDEFDGNMAGNFSKDELIDQAYLHLVEYREVVSIDWSIIRVNAANDAIIITASVVNSFGGNTESGTAKIWLSKNDEYRMIHSEGGWLFGSNLPMETETKLTAETVYYVGSPLFCEHLLRIILVAPRVPMDVDEVTVIFDTDCGFRSLPVTRAWYEAKYGRSGGFGGEFSVDESPTCTGSSCPDPYLIYYMVGGGGFSLQFHDYGYDLEELNIVTFP